MLCLRLCWHRRRMILGGEGSGECIDLWEALECSVCHPDVGVAAGPPPVCESFCNRVFAACQDAYFATDPHSQVRKFPCSLSFIRIISKLSMSSPPVDVRFRVTNRSDHHTNVAQYPTYEQSALNCRLLSLAALVTSSAPELENGRPLDRRCAEGRGSSQSTTPLRSLLPGCVSMAPRHHPQALF